MIASRLAVVSPQLQGFRFDVAAASLFSDLSRKKIKEIIDAGGAYCNKRRILIAKQQVRLGDKIELFWESRQQSASDGAPGSLVSHGNVAARAEKLQQAILFECDDFVVINKPAGIPSQATLISSTDTILHALHASNPSRFPLAHLHLVHRLDKDTSGIMMIARNKNMQRKIEDAFRDGCVKKEYEALCFCIPKSSEGKISYPIAPDRSRKNAWMPVFGARRPADAKLAETDYRVREVFRKIQASAITCFPATGRTHQIRVHLMAIGCPILGDKTYSNNIMGHSAAQMALRQMLHASRLQLQIPGVGNFQWVAPLPSDFTECELALRNMNEV